MNHAEWNSEFYFYIFQRVNTKKFHFAILFKGGPISQWSFRSDRLRSKIMGATGGSESYFTIKPSQGPPGRLIMAKKPGFEKKKFKIFFIDFPSFFYEKVFWWNMGRNHRLPPWFRTGADLIQMITDYKVSSWCHTDTILAGESGKISGSVTKSKIW